jgi:hypothetical protein
MIRGVREPRFECTQAEDETVRPAVPMCDLEISERISIKFVIGNIKLLGEFNFGS